VLDGVWVVQTGCFKNLLKMVFGWSGSPLEITFGSCHELLTGVVGFFPVTVIASHCSEAMESVLLPLLSALSALFGAFDGGLGRCGLATPGGRSHTTKGEGSLDSLLVCGVLGCNIEELLGSF
jgi:hypothetical protein